MAVAVFRNAMKSHTYTYIQKQSTTGFHLFHFLKKVTFNISWNPIHFQILVCTRFSSYIKTSVLDLRILCAQTETQFSWCKRTGSRVKGTIFGRRNLPCMPRQEQLTDGVFLRDVDLSSIHCIWSQKSLIFRELSRLRYVDNLDISSALCMWYWEPNFV
jgi:hypothetical protein